MGYKECAGLHNTSLIVFDVELDQTHLQCKDCGEIFDDPHLVNEALLVVIQDRIRNMFASPDLPSRDRPEAN